MTAAELDAYLKAHIPLSGALGIEVAESGTTGVAFRVPLAPNRNHQGTAFGGALAACAIGAAWALTVNRLAAEGLGAQVVIQREEMVFLHPVAADFEARAYPPDPDSWEHFLLLLRRKGRGRLAVDAEILVGNSVRATLRGWFVGIVGPAAEGAVTSGRR